MFSQASCRFERPVANALEQFKQLKPTHEMFDSCRNCGALQEGHENASAYAAAMAAEGPSLMELMGSVLGPQKHKKRSVSFASQAEVQTLTPEGGHQVLTSEPISTPKHESQSTKPDPKPDPKPNPSQPSANRLQPRPYLTQKQR